MKKVVVDRHTVPQEYPKKWKKVIGTGRLGLALQKEYLDHLAFVQKAIGFQYIRGHGLLHDDVGIYREIEVEGGRKPFYNFTYIDRIVDAYLEWGVRPFVEVGFMPKLLASGEQTLFTWEANVTPPKDYGQWASLIKAVISHFIERYGEAEVVQWPFEIWNEPNLVNFWKDADKEEYFKLYQVTAHAIKSVNPDIQVGGPAICGGSDEWIVDFLQFCYRERVPVDFVTRHAYTSRKPHKVTPDYYYQELAEPEKMLNEFKSVRALIEASPFPALPLHITEYNTSYSPVNPIHDTVCNAAYLARILSEGGDYADTYSYWTFSDVFEERDVPRAPFHGGFGLIGLGSVPKPTFHLFAFFNALGEERLYRDRETVVTRKPDGTIALVAWNLVTEKGDGFDKTISYVIPAPGDDLFIKRQTVDEQHANPWKTWKEMGRPRFPSHSMVNTLRQAAQPLLRTARAKSEAGFVTLDVTLTKNEVTLIEIVPVRDETDSYVGLDDALITSY